MNIITDDEMPAIYCKGTDVSESSKFRPPTLSQIIERLIHK
jgi:hypothetical protein